MALLRRLIQICIYGVGSVASGAGSSFECASLIVTSEVFKDKAETESHKALIQVVEEGIELWQSKFQNTSAGPLMDDGEEKFVDVLDEDDVQEQDATGVLEKEKSVGNKTASYDPFHRCPEYSKADTCSFWELSILVKHYHPSVRLFARTLLFHDRDGKTVLESNEIKYPSVSNI